MKDIAYLGFSKLPKSIKLLKENYDNDKLEINARDEITRFSTFDWVSILKNIRHQSMKNYKLDDKYLKMLISDTPLILDYIKLARKLKDDNSIIVAFSDIIDEIVSDDENYNGITTLDAISCNIGNELFVKLSLQFNGLANLQVCALCQFIGYWISNILCSNGLSIVSSVGCNNITNIIYSNWAFKKEDGDCWTIEIDENIYNRKIELLDDLRHIITNHASMKTINYSVGLNPYFFDISKYHNVLSKNELGKKIDDGNGLANELSKDFNKLNLNDKMDEVKVYMKIKEGNYIN